MNATPIDKTADTGRRTAPIDRPRHRPQPPLVDATAPARPDRAAHDDDGSHTPPHGDAVLQPRRP